MKKPVYWCCILIIILFTACNYFPDEPVAQLTAITNYDISVDYTQYATFAISNTVSYLQVNENGKPIIAGTTTGNTNIIVNAITDKLVNYCGYEQITTTDVMPDLLVDVLYVDAATVAIPYTDWWYYYDYWTSCNWYFPYYPYYPAYYYPATTPDYSAGTLIIDIKDIKNADGSSQNPTPVNAVWVGIVRGLQTDYTQTQLNDAIKDCFLQTPALKK